MDTKRLVNLVLGDLSLENMKLQDKLESTINSTTLDVDNKLIYVKSLLKDLTLNELSTAKFQQLIGANVPTAAPENNDTLNPEQNG